MLTYEYLNKDGSSSTFVYYPEGNRNAPGIVVIEEAGHGRIVESSKKDFGNRYAFHAIKGIDPAKHSGTIAWY